MNKIKFSLIVGVLAISQQSLATTVFASAQWLNVVIQPGPASFSFNSALDFHTADVNTNTDTPIVEFNAYSGATPGSAQLSGGLGDASWGTNAVSGSLFSGSTVFSGVEVQNAGNASSAARYDLGFTANGTGTIIIRMDYVLINEITGGASGLEFVEAGVMLSVSVGGDSSSAAVFLDGSADDSIFEDNSIFVSFNVDGFTEGFISFETFANADTGLNPVPLPAGIWLFGSAIGLLSVNRKRKNAMPHAPQ